MQRQFIALLYGWVFILLFIVVSSFVLALVLQFTTISQWMLSWVAFSVGLVGLFIGGMITGIKGKSKGWVVGGLTGLGFTLFIFLVQYLGYQNGFSIQQMLHHSGFILAAIFGGMIGVNLFQKDAE
ncbi:TIGR04086 family membrane protein [Oceanobacillus alkalisoli]|uniref:TIGR04086 family membrane protein n=1 Tax=Oceanobacillus alkalisoli TaxID=2925113 RepID=UPI001EEFA81F|nr:TIGR04086 family membrane protein [Oceanobacillus alkalisoli]MCF3941868.1 TIGR04086 family membrane protein [Oceanobacillus alkalisoli]MCG5104243.1 TIGR04086 family membrane protein [Oceanobacillus alkalisoli]